MVMSAVELNDEAMEAARREAKRRGVGVTEVVSEAVQRFVVGADLAQLLEEFRQRDEASSDALDEREALRIANEELAVVRQARR